MTQPRWRRPILDRAGQQVFWDRQAPTYDHEAMTTDNEGELEIARALCVDFAKRGYVAEDVVTLGGAIGCRDPLVVLEALRHLQQYPKQVFFNDLSREMVQTALNQTFPHSIGSGVSIEGICGPIHEVGEQIPPMPRRIIMGVYHATALTTASPLEGFPRSGLEEYVRSASILGDHFILETLSLCGERYQDTGFRYNMEATHAGMESAQATLEPIMSVESLAAVRIIGQHASLPGYFLSHWFTEQGIRALVETSFPTTRYERVTVHKCAKGMVLCIDPVQPPRGVLTILNNVLGNVISDEQVSTLRAIDRMSC